MRAGLHIGAGVMLECTECGLKSLTLVGSAATEPRSAALDPLQPGPDDEGEAWLAAAQRGLLRMAASGRTFQAYDLVQGGFVTEAPRSQLWGALFTRAAAAGHIVHAGTAPSKRAAGRRRVALWRATVIV